MRTEFFMPMVPPTVTHQEKKVTVVNGKPVFYEPPELKAARQKLIAHLAKHKPARKYKYGVRLFTECGFWVDDALVASEIVEKFWAKVPGIYIQIEDLR